MENISKWAIAKILENYRTPVPIEDLCKKLIDPIILDTTKKIFLQNKNITLKKNNFIDIYIYKSYRPEVYDLIKSYRKDVIKYYKKQGWKKIICTHGFFSNRTYFILKFYA